MTSHRVIITQVSDRRMNVLSKGREGMTWWLRDDNNAGETREEKEGKHEVWAGKKGVTVFVNSPRKSTAKSGLNEEVTQCSALQTRRAESPPSLCVRVSVSRVSPEIRPIGTIHHRSRRKKRRGEGNIKKRGTTKGRRREQRKIERKEQVLVLKRAAMRGGAVRSEPTG